MCLPWRGKSKDKSGLKRFGVAIMVDDYIFFKLVKFLHLLFIPTVKYPKFNFFFEEFSLKTHIVFGDNASNMGSCISMQRNEMLISAVRGAFEAGNDVINR